MDKALLLTTDIKEFDIVAELVPKFKPVVLNASLLVAKLERTEEEAGRFNEPKLELTGLMAVFNFNKLLLTAIELSLSVLMLDEGGDNVVDATAAEADKRFLLNVPEILSELEFNEEWIGFNVEDICCGGGIISISNNEL